MAKNETYNRRINLYINGKEIKNNVSSIKGEMRKLVAAQRKMTIGSKEYNKAGQDIQRLNGILKQHRQELYGTQSRWSKMGEKLKQFKTIALAALSAAVLKAFQGIIRQTKEFEKALSSLSAITGATGRDLQFYSDEAIRMGRTSTKSANEIVKSMELIGSAKPELLDNKEALSQVTEETLMLAEASGMTMPKAAKSLTKAMNQFSLPAEEAGRAVNVLAAGAKEGAAAIPDISSAIVKFGTVAESANISIEESVGMIEMLAEKGMAGSEAGTNLRNVILELQKGADETNPAVVGLSTALENLSDQNMTAAELAKRFGKENVTAAQILAENASTVDEYTEAVTGTSVAQEQQIKQTRNLSSEWAKFTNKVNAMILGLGQRGDFNNFLSGLVRSAGNVVDVFNDWIEVPIEKKLREEQREVNILASRLSDANTPARERRNIIERLNEISPSMVEGLEAENLNYEQLKDNLQQYNTELSNRIILGNLQEEEEEKLSELAKIRTEEAEKMMNIRNEMVKVNEDIALGEGTREEKMQAIIEYLQEEVRLQKEAGEAGRRIVTPTAAGTATETDTRTEEQKALERLQTMNEYLKRTTEERIEIEEESQAYSKRVAQLKEILGLTKEVKKEEEDDEEDEDVDPDVESEEEKNERLKELREERKAAEEKLAEEIISIRRKLDLEDMSQQDRERARIEQKYEDLEEEAKEFEFWEDYKADVANLKEREIAEHEKKWQEKRKEEKQKLEEQIFELTATSKEKQIAEVKEQYQTVIAQAEKAGLATAELYQKMQEKIAEIKGEGGEETEEKDIFGMTPTDWEYLRSNFDNALQYIDEIGRLWGSINEIQNNKEEQAFQRYAEKNEERKKMLNDRLEEGAISQEQYNARVANLEAELDEKRKEMDAKQAKREKKLRIFEATVNTAAAVVEALPNIPLSILVGATGAAQIAAIASEPVPEYATGGFTNGDRIYRAGEAGTEWIADNDMVNDPYTGPVISMLEDIRRNKRPAEDIFSPARPNTSEIQKVPAFQRGGYTAPDAATASATRATTQPLPAEDSETMAAMRQMSRDMRELRNFMSDPANRQAVINYNTLKKQNQEDDLRNRIGRIG